MGFHQTAISNSFMGVAPLRRSAEALPVACDALNARTAAVKKYHYTDIWIVAAELLSLLWNTDISRSACPSFRRRVSVQWLPIYRTYLIALYCAAVILRRFLCQGTKWLCFRISNEKEKGAVKTFRCRLWLFLCSEIEDSHH